MLFFPSGIFIARISRGRTIREFIIGTLVVPVLYAFFWLVVFSGIGIEMEREAAYHGLCCNRTEKEEGFFVGYKEFEKQVNLIVVSVKSLVLV